MNVDQGSTPDDSVKTCANCGTENHRDAQYCDHCGQQFRSRLVPIRSLISEFFETLLNIDSRFFHTVINLYKPGYLTKEFFRGREVNYYRPMRLFVTTLLLLYAVLGLFYFGKMEAVINQDAGHEDYLTRKHAIALIEAAKPVLQYDTLPQGSQMWVDSLIGSLDNGTATFDIQLTNKLDTTANKDLAIPVEDVYDLETDSLLSKYGIEGVVDRTIVRQLIRAQREPGKAVQSMLANTSWMILLLMPFLAFILKLAYLRRKRYYVEHLVFLLHYHSMVFVTLIVYLLALQWISDWIALGISVFCLVFLLLSMKRYYAQGWAKTITKYLLILMSYVAMFLMFSGLTIFVSLLIYR